MFQICVTCESCGLKFILTYGAELVCPACGSKECQDQFDDWEWW